MTSREESTKYMCDIFIRRLAAQDQLFLSKMRNSILDLARDPEVLKTYFTSWSVDWDTLIFTTQSILLLIYNLLLLSIICAIINICKLSLARVMDYSGNEMNEFDLIDDALEEELLREQLI
ncbi:MAG: hypothetical protein MHMPM18_000470 [Marteilia pararefringens]